MNQTPSIKEKIVKWGILTGILLVALLFVVLNHDTFFNRIDRNFLATNNYKNILIGLGNTFIIATSGFAIGLVLGIGVCILQGLQSQKVIILAAKQVLSWYVALFRGTPTAVQLLIIYYIIFSSFSGNPIWVAVLVFGLNSGAYVSEIMRGGINAVSKGQMEAGRALGLSYQTVMFKIIIPQAIRNALPSLFNEFITLIKETSIAGFIGAVDLTLAFRKIANATYDYEIVYLIMGLVYFILILIITNLLTKLEKKVSKHDRT